MFDARAKLDSKKRIYKSVRGFELNVTFKPFGITKLSVEYTNAYYKAVEVMKEYNSKPRDKLTDKDVELLEKTLKDFTDLGKEIVLASLAVNGQDYDEQWLNDHLVAEEFKLLVSYILEEENDNEKKTNSSDGNQTQQKS